MRRIDLLGRGRVPALPIRRGPISASVAALWILISLGSAEAEVPAEAGLDFAGHPVMRSTRITAMGGAHLGVAEGVHGFLLTPAAAANPFAHNRASDFDWDGVVEINRLGSTRQDFDNSGSYDPDFDELRTLALGATLTMGEWGLGLAVESYRYRLTLRDETDTHGSTFEVVTSHFGYARSSFSGALLWGIALRAGSAQLETTRVSEIAGRRMEMASGLERFTGAALEGGVLWRPLGRSWRMGATFRTPVTAEPERAQGLPNEDFVGPANGIVPYELAAGVAWHVGGRSLNRRIPAEPEPEPPTRGGLLLVADLVLTGPAEESLSVQAFLEQRDQPSGESVSLSPRVGAELEAVQNFLKLRGGSYLEPARVSGGTARLHATGGFEMRLVHIDWLDMTLAWSTMVDWAPRYIRYSIAGLGLWH